MNLLLRLSFILSFAFCHEVTNLRIYENIAEVNLVLPEPILTIDKQDFASVLLSSISVDDFNTNYSLHFPSLDNLNNVDVSVRRGSSLEAAEIVDYSSFLVKSKTTGKYFYVKPTELEFDALPSAINIEIKQDGNVVPRALNATYLCTGLSWRMYHECILKDDKALFKTWVEITNSLKTEINAHHLELITGNLKLSNFAPAKIHDFLLPRDLFHSSENPDNKIFEIGNGIVIKGGETKKIPLNSNIFDCKKIRYVDFKLGVGKTEGTTFKSLKINNTEYIYSAPVLVRENQHVISEYMLPAIEKDEGLILALGSDENVHYRRTGRIIRRLSPGSYELGVEIEFNNTLNYPIIMEYAELAAPGDISEVITNFTNFIRHHYDQNRVSFTIGLEPHSKALINYNAVVQ